MKLPAALSVTRHAFAVASFVWTVQKINDAAATVEFVTVMLEAPAAKFTVPAGLLIVWFPVVPDAVTVR